MIRVSEESFDPGAELSAFEKSAQGAGAVVSFLGKVRDLADGEDVRALYLEHYPGVTERSITDIEAEARRRWTIDDALIIHRVGEMKAGEPIVMVCVASAHRRDAFEAADFLMDYLKTEAMFWKKELRDGGEAWIEPRDADYKDAARWRKDD
ncbi:molybdenum cofactor biosynthesis protein MoaE [Hyphococcus sp.]|uniref:molybdenum cofactor biosynthesis protein MoaE n=1 Tax=Hyphococcus sp. TaxID=2038636 RepID=UPI003D126B18